MVVDNDTLPAWVSTTGAFVKFYNGIIMFLGLCMYEKSPSILDRPNPLKINPLHVVHVLSIDG